MKPARLNSNASAQRQASVVPMAPAADEGSALSSTAASEFQAQPAKAAEIPTLDQLLSSVHDTLIQKVREETGANFRQSRMAVLTVLAALWDAITVSDEAASAVATVVQEGLDVPDADMEELQQLFQSITHMKEDTQQRNWAVQDDETSIRDMLDRFCKIVQVGEEKKKVGARRVCGLCFWEELDGLRFEHCLVSPVPTVLLLFNDLINSTGWQSLHGKAFG